MTGRAGSAGRSSERGAGTTVFAGDVGVFVGNNGEVCPLVSTQDW